MSSLLPWQIFSPTPIYCKMFKIFSYSSVSFSESQACRKCRLLMDLEVRLSKLETRLRTTDSIVAPATSQQQLACAARPSLAGVSCSPAAPEQPGSQGGWVAVRRKRSPKQRPMVHQCLLNLGYCFSPLGDTPTGKLTLDIGDSVLR